MAKAIEGRKYAQIINGRCHWKFTKAQLPEWNDALQAVDITDLQQEPNEGDLYDEQTGAFSPAPVTQPTPEETAREARRLALQDEMVDNFIDKLRGATPDEIKTYVQSNVTDLASARALMLRLAVAVSYVLHGGVSK